MTDKRENVLSWDEYFMAMAQLSALRSKDPSTQVGACIVNSENRIVGAGYNGFPIGCSDDFFPWASEGDFAQTKNPYVCHAELNAVLNAVTNLQGCRIYVSLFPCHECAKVIIQAGIKEVIFLSDRHNKTDSNTAAKVMMRHADIWWRRFETLRDCVHISFQRGDI